MLLLVTDSHAACGSGGGGGCCGSRDAGTHGGSVFVSCRSGEGGGLARCGCCCGFAGGEDTAEAEGWCAKTTTRSETLIVCEEGVPSAGAAEAGWTMPVPPRPRGAAAAAAAAERCCCCCLRASAPRRRKPEEDLRRGASSGDEADDDADTERDDGSDAVPRNDRDDDREEEADENPRDRDRDDEKECRRRRRRRPPRGSARRCPLPALTLPPALPCPEPRAGLTGFRRGVVSVPSFVLYVRALSFDRCRDDCRFLSADVADAGVAGGGTRGCGAGLGLNASHPLSRGAVPYRSASLRLPPPPPPPTPTSPRSRFRVGVP